MLTVKVVWVAKMSLIDPIYSRDNNGIKKY